MLVYGMMLLNGKEGEEDNNTVSFGVAGQAYISNCSLILFWTPLVSSSCPKINSKLQKQDIGEVTPFQKSHYECDVRATSLHNFAQYKIEICQ